MNIGVFFSKLVQKTEKPLSHGTINEYNYQLQLADEKNLFLIHFQSEM